MSIFGNIMGKIFGHQASASPGATPAGSPSGPAPSQSTTASTTQPGSTTRSASAGPATSSQPSSTQPVDVEGVLRDLASKKKEQLNWRQSIVDLMKLLDLDSSFAARKELAKELHYTGALDGSAEMNMWLHKQVMTKLAENGGKVPADLRHSA